LGIKKIKEQGSHKNVFLWDAIAWIRGLEEAWLKSKLKKPSLARQCEMLKINRTSLYYTKSKRLIHSIDNNYAIEIMNSIDEIYTSHPYYGYRRMYHAIKQKGYSIGEKGVYKLMKIMNIQGLHPRKKINTSVPNKISKKYPYLLKETDITRPNQVWASDISYIRLKNGFAYLCAIIDLHTRAIISHKLSNTMDDNLVISTIEDALLRYKKPEIFNSDQGSQYTSNKVINLLKKHNISISMDAKGRCFDNIIMERFWRTLKQENVYPKGYETIRQARKGIYEYIETYNNQRLHSSIGYMQPIELYRRKIGEVA